MIYLVVFTLFLAVLAVMALLCLWVVCRKLSEVLFYFLGRTLAESRRKENSKKKHRDASARSQSLILDY